MTTDCSQESQQAGLTPPPSKKNKVSGFNTVRKIAEANSSGLSVGGSVDVYLKKQRSEETESPLVYCRINKDRFAILSKMYLSVPVTSGSAERLFSIAGAIGRARRAKLPIDN